MEKMIYVCPVDWSWLKQRPQFLAEELSRSYNLYILYPWKNNRKGLQKEDTAELNRHPYFSIPSLGGKIHGIQWINKHLHKLQFYIHFHAVQPEYIWFTHPDQLAMLPSHYTGIVIYDCMDDYAAIEMNSKRQSEIQNEEYSLVRRANVIFASSQTILLRLLKEYQVNSNKVFLVRNGYNAKWKTVVQTQLNPYAKLRIGYWGTIGRWFDFDLLQASLEHISEIEYHLFGATEKGVAIPKCDRLIYHGVIEHATLPQLATQLDVLMMPFKLTKVVESVDPVKLYEYIFMRKPIISIWYEEIKRFAPFVLFYQNEEMFTFHLKQLLVGKIPIYSDEQTQNFLAENSWGCRAKQIQQAIMDYTLLNEKHEF